MAKSVGTIPIPPSPKSMLEYQQHIVRKRHQLIPTLIQGEGGIEATHNDNDSLGAAVGRKFIVH